MSFAALDALDFPKFEPGTVWLVGAGPGAPGLLSLLGYHALQQAEVVVYDALVSEALLALANPAAGRIPSGKRGGKPSLRQADISPQLVELTHAGKRVARLKGGDPSIFGRGGEEAGALARAGVPFRIVPGISSGLGGLAYAGIPVMHRDANHPAALPAQVVVEATLGEAVGLGGLETPAIVVLGPVSAYREVRDWYGPELRGNALG